MSLRIGHILMMAASCTLAAVSATQAAAPGATAPPLPSLQERGKQTLAMIDKTFAATGRDVGNFLEELKPTDPKFKPHAVYAWGGGIQFSAFNAAARLDPQRYRAAMLRYAKVIDTYWYIDKDGLGGFCAAQRPTKADRYYDDNAWICLDFCDAYELTGDKALLETARKTMTFMLSGRDEKLGDGTYWHEQKKTSKNTCINAPAAVSALRLYKLTGEKTYLDTATQLYQWTKSKLQDSTDGLYFDSINLEGKVAPQKYSYNTALMIRAACLLFDQTGDAAYLTEAGRLCRASEAKWFQPDGSVKDNSYFGHLMVEAMLEYGQRAKDKHWTELAVRTCDFVWQKNRAPDGHFPEHWDKLTEKPLDRYKLMWEASNARLFFRVAEAAAAR